MQTVKAFPRSARRVAEVDSFRQEGASAMVQGFPQGLPLGYTHQGGVPENLQTILSLRRSELVRRLCIQRLR
ncbi:hypothetical protein FOXYSP1_09206 [Fusarium oxysporum f. sp. phaseoli]